MGVKTIEFVFDSPVAHSTKPINTGGLTVVLDRGNPQGNPNKYSPINISTKAKKGSRLN